MFWLKYFFRNVILAFRLVLRGDLRRVCRAAYARAYRGAYATVFWLKLPFIRRSSSLTSEGAIKIVTNHPVAFSSPDHLMPYGTKYNNSTNRKFVLYMNKWIRSHLRVQDPCFMDLGCSGGQLVEDFRKIGWVSVGLEGSDYSLKHRRANWRTLANKNLFTCDITKPFQVTLEQKPLRFHLITAWEVLEHIQTSDLPVLFDNISKHLADGGIFIASTASGSSIVDGVELHQTRWVNAEWRRYLQARFPELTLTDVSLKTHQYVRYDFGEPSFLVYQKVPVPSPSARARDLTAVQN
jgi:2-polyprenyl-3-methyl-5-hydroxy-6-metoxy-1,4-benzoquinol methylase